MSAPTRTALGEPAHAPAPVSGAGTTIRELPGSGGARTGAVGSSSITYAQYATFLLCVTCLTGMPARRHQLSLERISLRPGRRFGFKLLPSLRQRPAHRLADVRVLRIKLGQRVHDHRRGADPREPLMVGR